ncbi:MAG TPA: O-antigen ligase family protein [Gaiellaceae bacterium]
MRAAGERGWPAAAGLAACFCALFFSQGLATAPLVWIGAIALVGAAACLLVAPVRGVAAAVYLGCLWGLALWCGLSILWSASPDTSWVFTNRTLVYAAFATLGVFVGPNLDAVAAAATALAAAVLGWALLAKCVPALYPDYGRLARLRAPLADWNMLALVCVAAVALALWLAVRARVAGTVLLFFAVVTLLLTYSRFGVALACAAALAWIVLERDRVEALATVAAGGGAGVAAFGIALALDGITSDHQSRSTRAHDGWVFVLVLLAGAALVALAGLLIERLHIAPHHRRAVERAAALGAVAFALAGLGVTFAKAHTIWHEFTNPVATQVPNNQTRFTSLGSGNRWTWWQEAWDGFTGRPLGGTGAGTFRFTDLRLRQSSDFVALEPHNTPLQFLSETGIVGFLLFAGAAGAALWAALRRRGVLAILVAAFFAHSIVHYDWSFVAVCGPFLFLGGVLVAEPAAARVRRPLLAAAAVAFAFACVYSLAAPWLAERAQASATSLADLKQAHSYDPLNTQIVVERAAFQTGRAAERSYRDALALEPTNAAVWYDLATFYAENELWTPAYRALAKAYKYDPFGPAGQCGLAAEIRRKVGLKVTCRGGG